VELTLNLVWVSICLLVLGTAGSAVRRGKLPLPKRTAFTAALVICFLLLPAISMTDDLLAAHQADLPLAAQTWHMASEGAAVGLELASVLCTCWLAFLGATLALRATVETDWNARPQAAWLLRSQRLRPPPLHFH